jgi:hypothetical protein
MLMAKIPKMKWLVIRPSQHLANAVHQPHGFRIFRFERDDRGEDEPFRAAASERETLVS